MLKNYRDWAWERENWAKCPECKTSNRIIKAYYVCDACGYIQKKYQEVNKQEERNQKIITKIITDLLHSDTPKIIFAEDAPLLMAGAMVCPGIYEKPPFHRLIIPRKSFYLPKKELGNVVAHESAHVPTWEEDEKNFEQNKKVGWNDKQHGPEWYNTYLDFLPIVENQLNNLVEEARFTLDEPIPTPKSYYQLEYAFDPKEDD